MVSMDVRTRAHAEPVRGDVVRVRSRAEILATLDAKGSLEAMPFMPEMLTFAGQELTVSARADKTCDTITYGGNRRLEKTVHLVGARCDGSAHDGCQASCLLYFRQEWLEWPDRPGMPITPPATPPRDVAAEATLVAHTRVMSDTGETLYRCQATELLDASSPLPYRDLTQYVRDVRTGNVSMWRVIAILPFIIFNKYQRDIGARLPRWLQIRGGRQYPNIEGTGTGERTPVHGLKVGDLVEVRSREEIMATLGPDNANRRLAVDVEMLPYCGKRFRVQRLVKRIVDDRTSKMIKLSDCVVLEDVVCQGTYHRFCPRAITIYWREAWLRRIDEGAPAPPRMV